MRALVALLALILLLLPAVYGAAQPDNLTQGLSPEDIEWKRRIDEKINMTELKELWEKIKDAPTPELIPEPNVYVSGRGYVTDEQGRFIKRGINVTNGPIDVDRYYDIYGNSFYVYLSNKLIFGKVESSQFKGTYFSVFNDRGDCLNCATGVQTFSDYKHYNNWIKPYVENNYPNYYRIHVKYFIQAILTDYVSKNGKVVYLKVRDITGNLVTRFEAELWSQADFYRSSEVWQLYGYPNHPDGGASYIRGKRLSVSVGYAYYALPYPDKSSRSFGHPYVITLWSRFYHQFAIISAS